MKKFIFIAIISAAAMVLSCGPRLIEGTTIADNDTNRAILKVFQEYAQAFQEKNADKIVKNVSEKYYDPNGTDQADDDVDYNGIKTFLNSAEFKEIVRIEPIFVLKELTVEGDKAKLLFFFEARYKGKDETTPARKSVLNDSNEKWEKVSDINIMMLQKEKDGWKIISGI